ncbi:hypothetical protein K493DRAFT_371243 [Basidiobolus meristosporus CBS 931.73]|uniref:Uncharacterized protein n=1 Tax=Basidiobolus meristosporus CBS 931.73 TaxID=1314790 RepID=A0A1Y1YDY9_9FUNG|nr:hypothetical protein K493DRAFT_371243 [Basidiobolus meristosporus CBS 931.73]|eukprot:ORX96217.1 hypothetical protein K493DRAFT_371243 [Basidiobolus meristosporus CBS 931.73]
MSERTFIIGATVFASATFLASYFLIKDHLYHKNRKDTLQRTAKLQSKITEIRYSFESLIHDNVKEAADMLKQFNDSEYDPRLAKRIDTQLLGIPEMMLRLLEQLDGVRQRDILPTDKEPEEWEMELFHKLKRKKKSLIEKINKEMNRLDEMHKAFQVDLVNREKVAAEKLEDL